MNFDDLMAIIGGAPSWKTEGRCASVDPDLWFPETPGEAKKANANAKAICGRCVVQSECLRDALANGERGTWGGTTEEERDEMRAADQAVAA